MALLAIVKAPMSSPKAFVARLGRGPPHPRRKGPASQSLARLKARQPSPNLGEVVMAGEGRW